MTLPATIRLARADDLPRLLALFRHLDAPDEPAPEPDAARDAFARLLDMPGASVFVAELPGAPPMLELPADHPRPSGPSTEGAHEKIALPPSLLESLEAFSRREGATLFMTMFAAFAALLQRYTGQDDIVVIPESAYRRQFGIKGAHLPFGGRGGDMTMSSIMISALPVPDAPQEQVIQEVETLMRIRHGLRLDDENDFDVLTQDSVMKMFDQISNSIFMALLVISSIALLVGGIGVMAIMTISVTERTREIGVRKAIGARRREILVQFLIEAAVLTSVGGLLGVLIGSAIGLLVNVVSGFPVSLPWWSFALGLGFTAAIGIFFGMLPAWRASRLDPIEALRYE